MKTARADTLPAFNTPGLFSLSQIVALFSQLLIFSFNFKTSIQFSPARQNNNAAEEKNRVAIYAIRDFFFCHVYNVIEN